MFRNISGNQIFTIVYALIHIAFFIFGFLKQKNDKDLSNINTIGLSVYISRGAGLVLGFDSSVLLLPVCRTLIRTLRSWKVLNNRWIRIPFNESLLFHKQTARYILLFTIIHVNAHYINFFTLEENSKKIAALSDASTSTTASTSSKITIIEALHLHYRSWAGLTGHIMLLIMFLLYTTSKKEIRIAHFETFYITHHLSFLFYGALLVHGVGCFVVTNTGHCKGYQVWHFSMFGCIMYVIERLLRWIQSQSKTNLTKIIFHPGNTMELRFQIYKELRLKSDPTKSIQELRRDYKPGQYVFIQIPEISKIQWHPFTLTSSPNENFWSVHIRVAGDWTKELATRFQCIKTDIKKDADDKISTNNNIYQDELIQTKIYVNGPFGAPAEDALNYKTLVLIGAGIGVTPFASILKYLLYEYQHNSSKLKPTKIFFFWVNRDQQAFEWFQNLLSILEESMPNGFLYIHIYMTGKMDLPSIQNIMMNDPSTELDPLTDLKSKTYYGRPDFIKIFQQIKSELIRTNHEYFNEVGVFFCGPKPLAQVLKKVSKSESDGKCKFHFYKENF